MKNIVIFGSSGYSKKIVSIAEMSGFKIAGFIDSFRLPGEETLGYNVLGKEQDIPSLIDKYPDRMSDDAYTKSSETHEDYQQDSSKSVQ